MTNEDEEDLTGIIPQNCLACGIPIPLIRLYYIPTTKYCVGCADKHTPQRINDPEILCSKASPSGQNGFSPKS